MKMAMTDQELAEVLRKRYSEAIHSTVGDMDVEKAHIEADKFLCWVLTIVGYPGLAQTFEELEKWYG